MWQKLGGNGGLAHPLDPLSMDPRPINDRFFGTFEPVLDAKNRVTVPAPWRSEGMEGLMAFFDDSDGVIWLFDREELVRMGQEVFRNPNVSRGDAKNFREHLYSTSLDCPVDAQGRLVLPAGFVARLGAVAGSQKISLVGMGPRIEVRAADRHAVRAPSTLAGFQRAKEVIDL